MRTINVDQVLPNISSMFLWLSNTKSMTFGRSKSVPNTLILCLIVSDKTNILRDFYDFVESNTNTKSVHIVRSDETWYERVRCSFGTPKGHTFGFGKPQEHT